jgi:hypothetical protein
LRDPDHVVFARAIAEDRVIVTENAEDFRKLAGGVDLHPGVIILPSAARAKAPWLMDLTEAAEAWHRTAWLPSIKRSCRLC